VKKFKFRLQRVLDVRNRTRDERRQELVTANLARDEAIQHLEDLQALSLQQRVQEGGTYSAGELMMFGAYAKRLQLEIETQVVRVEEAKVAAEEARERYVEASREARALEMLEAKQRADHTELVAKKDGEFLDELSIQRAKRGS
jgi:flagellar FliJ protein